MIWNQHKITFQMVYNMTVFDDINFYLYGYGAIPPFAPQNNVPGISGRDAPFQNTLNMLYFRNQTSKKLPPQMGHGRKEVHPTI